MQGLARSVEDARLRAYGTPDVSVGVGTIARRLGAGAVALPRAVRRIPPDRRVVQGESAIRESDELELTRSGRSVGCAHLAVSVCKASAGSEYLGLDQHVR